MALNDEISWTTLSSILDDLSPTLSKSKEIIQILVKELYSMKERCMKDSLESMNFTDMTETKNDAFEDVNQSSELVLPDRNSVDDEYNPENIPVDYDFEFKDVEAIQFGEHEKDEILYSQINNEESETFSDSQGENEEFEDLPVKNQFLSSYQEKVSLDMKVKKFQCKTCTKAFSKNKELERHERIHTGEKPFQCDKCKKSFSQIANLKRHSRIHTGEKPFHCNTCTRSFNQLDTLKDHVRIHADEKLFECSDCDLRFNQKRSLRKHKYKCHI